MNILPDGSAFFIADIDTSPDRQYDNPCKWNPFNKVFQDHRDGTVLQPQTAIERRKRGMQNWTPKLAEHEVHQPPVW